MEMLLKRFEVLVLSHDLHFFLDRIFLPRYSKLLPVNILAHVWTCTSENRDGILQFVHLCPFFVKFALSVSELRLSRKFFHRMIFKQDKLPYLKFIRFDASKYIPTNVTKENSFHPLNVTTKRFSRLCLMDFSSCKVAKTATILIRIVFWLRAFN